VIPSRGPVFAFPAPVDLRRGFDGLYGLVARQLGRDPLDGALYLFTNASRKSAKVLHFDGTGLCIYHKRLARGRFASLWQRADGRAVSLTRAELALFLEGCRLLDHQPLSPPAVTRIPVATNATF